MACACSPRASCAGRRRKSCPPRADGSNVSGGDPVRPEARAASRRARGKRLRGAAPSLPDRDFTGGSEGRPRSGFVETVTLQQHRARPGRPAPSPTFPAAMPESEDAWMEGGQWPVASGCSSVRGRAAQAAPSPPAPANHQQPTTNPQNHRKTACPKPVHPVPTPGQRCHPANAPG